MYLVALSIHDEIHAMWNACALDDRRRFVRAEPLLGDLAQRDLSFGSASLVWQCRIMNPHAKETVPEYNFRKCSEDLEQARLERRIVRSLFLEAKRTDAKKSAAMIESWLPRSRLFINRLSARKTRLRRKLEISRALAAPSDTTHSS